MTKTATRTLTHKAGSASSVAPTRAVKLADEGIVVAIVAVTGVVDNVNDLIVPGVFAESLRIRRPKVVEDHEWSRKVGRVLHVEEWLPGDPRLPKKTKEGRPWPKDAGALVATMQYLLATQEGRDAFERVKFYAESNEAEFSIGYRVPEGKANKRADGVRVIFGIALFEFSHVLFGAASLTTALEVKSLNGATAGTSTKPALGRTEQVGDDLDEDDTTPAPPLAPGARWDDDTEESAVESKTALDTVLEAKGLDVPAPAEGKAMGQMRGSYQERTRLVEVAARDLFEATYNDPCVCVVATYDAEVVVRLYLRDGEEPSFVLPYSIVDGGVELGSPEPVELSLVAEPGGGVPEATEPPSVDEVAAIQPANDASDFLTTVITTFEASHSQERKDAAAALRARLAQVLETKTADPEDETTDAAADAPPAVQVDADTITRDQLPEGDWQEYRKTEPIEALRMDGPFKVQTREGVVESDDGWLAIDSDGWPYPIAADEFDSVYEPANAPAEDTPPAEGQEATDPAAEQSGFAGVVGKGDAAAADETTDEAEPTDEETITVAPEDMPKVDDDEPAEVEPDGDVDDLETKGLNDDAEPPAAEEADPEEPEGDDQGTVTLNPDEHFDTMAELDSDEERDAA